MQFNLIKSLIKVFRVWRNKEALKMECNKVMMCTHTPPPSFCRGRGGGGLSLQPNFQKGGELDKTSTFRRGLLEKRGVTFFRGGCSCHIK